MEAAQGLGKCLNPFDLPRVGLWEKFSLPSKPGLYFVIDGDFMLYVGKSKDLKGRWKSHHRYKQIESMAANPEIAFLDVDGEDLLWVERDVINRFKPLLNDTKVERESKPKSEEIRIPSSSEVDNFACYAEMDEVFKRLKVMQKIYGERRLLMLKDLAGEAVKLIAADDDRLNMFLSSVKEAHEGLKLLRASMPEDIQDLTSDK